MIDIFDLSPYLDPKRILSFADANKEQILDALIENLGGIVDNPTQDLIKDAILAREKDTSTGIGNGVAIPHARIDDIDDTIISIARIEEGANWDAIDEKPVHLVFLIITNIKEDRKYIRLLSRLMLRLKEESYVQKLAKAETTEALYQILTGKQD